MTELRVDTPVGPARLVVEEAARPRVVLVLGHGAGAGVETRDLQALATDLPGRGITVVRMEQPWRVAGRRVAAPPGQLDQAWAAALAHVTRPRRGRLVVGGRSAGARVACRTAAQVGASAVVALAFPLHPPGRPDRSRADELLGSGVLTLVVQGARDAFGGPEEIPAGPSVVAIPGADHGFAVGKRSGLTQSEALAMLTEAVGDWVLDHSH